MGGRGGIQRQVLGRQCRGRSRNPKGRETGRGWVREADVEQEGSAQGGNLTRGAGGRHREPQGRGSVPPACTAWDLRSGKGQVGSSPGNVGLVKLGGSHHDYQEKGGPRRPSGGSPALGPQSSQGSCAHRPGSSHRGFDPNLPGRMWGAESRGALVELPGVPPQRRRGQSGLLAQ